MDKQKLIDKAVNARKGVNKDNCIIAIPVGKRCELHIHPEEFTERARELGWINGYQWGKEYPTNGKKPDLPDGTGVEFKSERLIGWSKTRVEYVAWVFTLSFRIVDDRYKPKQTESHSKPSADNSWHERGELPPVGTECEVYGGVYGKNEMQWKRVKVYAHIDGCGLSESTEVSRQFNLYHPHEYRPIKSERESLIDVIASAGNLSDGMLADAIISAGWSRA